MVMPSRPTDTCRNTFFVSQSHQVRHAEKMLTCQLFGNVHARLGQKQTNCYMLM